MLKPNAEFNRITDITVDFLKQNNIKAVILDVDNTLIDLDRKPLRDIKKWSDNLKDSDIKICIASNSIRKNKVKNISEKLDVPFIYFSTKPLKRGLSKAIKILNEKRENIAEIGDQLFTDVWGSKRMKLFSILTKPISEEKTKLGSLKRKIEKKYIEKTKEK